MELALTILAVFLVLVASELWWRKHNLHGELSRKFVHITVGSFVAFWPFFLSWQQIELLSVALVVVIGISRALNIFQAIHSVQRPTWGELFFAAAVGLVALITHDKWIYAAALLQMSLADGLAAIVGRHYGNRMKYLVFGHAKSVAGTLTFFAISVAILLAFSHWGGQPLSLAFVLAISALASVLENIGVLGSDNLLVPVLVAIALVNH